MTSTALFRTQAEIARRRFERSGPISVDMSFGTILLRLTGALPSLEALWEELQATAPCSSAQTYDWAKASARHLLGPEGREPVIAVACADDGRPLFLWPFEMAPAAGMKVLRWLGQDHANYNMGLFAPEAAPKFTANDLSRLLAEVARETGAVAAILRAQPFSWDGMANPFAELPRRPTPSSGYAVTLGDFAALYEKRLSKRSRHALERNARKLAEAGPPEFGWAETRDQKLALLDTLFAQKSRQFAAMGVKEGAMILDLVHSLKDKGMSIIMIAHNYGQVLEVCDRVNLIQGGQITLDKLSSETSAQELTDLVVAEYRKALEERHRAKS